MRLLRLVEIAVTAAGFIVQGYVVYVRRAVSDPRDDLLAIALTIFAAICVLAVPYVPSRRSFMIIPASLLLIALGFFPWQGFLMLALFGILGSRMALLYGSSGAFTAWLIAAVAIGTRTYVQASMMGEPFWLFLYSAGSILALLALLFAALAVLAQALAQVRSYASRAAETGALEERSRIAIELHDALGHRLTTASVQVQSAESLLSADPTRAQEFLRRGASSIAGALNEVRETVGLLRDTNPEAHLSQRLEALLEEFSTLDTFEIVWSINLSSRQPTALALALFRIVQESLTNIARHAGPCSIQATVVESDGFVRVKIADTGAGFDPSRIADGTGLRAMRDRVAVLGGILDIQSMPAAGTTIDVRFPQGARS